jgi:glycerol-3-phosphate dehydrogenase
MPLQGAAESLQATQDGLQRQRQQLEALLPDTALRGAQVAHLQGTYGLEAVALIERAEPSRRKPLSPVIPLCTAELVHAIQREHARSSSDVLARRCRLAMVDLSEAERLRPQVEALLDQAGVAAGSTSPINHQLNP